MLRDGQEQGCGWFYKGWETGCCALRGKECGAEPFAQTAALQPGAAAHWLATQASLRRQTGTREAAAKVGRARCSRARAASVATY